MKTKRKEAVVWSKQQMEDIGKLPLSDVAAAWSKTGGYGKLKVKA